MPQQVWREDLGDMEIDQLILDYRTGGSDYCFSQWPAGLQDLWLFHFMCVDIQMSLLGCHFMEFDLYSKQL